jgi:hypothetical protein
MPSTTTTTTASRARLAGAFILLCSGLVGCATTSMTARSARLPVLLGPVACIGCTAATSPQASTASPISDSVHNSGGYVLLPYLGNVGFFGANAPSIDLTAESMAPDPCKAEVRVSGLNVESFGVVAFVYAKSEQTVDLTGHVQILPSGTCGPRPWPYSGPQGIVYPEPATPPGGSP